MISNLFLNTYRELKSYFNANSYEEGKHREKIGAIIYEVVTRLSLGTMFLHNTSNETPYIKHFTISTYIISEGGYATPDAKKLKQVVEFVLSQN